MGNHSDNSRISESRKIRKPIMEKKRRARINESLETLKKILLECNLHKTDQKNVKLEKADVLEMTVRYLQHLKTNAGMRNINPCGEKVVQICPADSSTSDLKSNSFFEHAVASNDRRKQENDNLPKYIRNGVLGYGGLHANTLPLATYNCVGANMTLSVTYASNQRFYGRIPRQPDFNPTENVWRPW